MGRTRSSGTRTDLSVGISPGNLHRKHSKLKEEGRRGKKRCLEAFSARNSSQKGLSFGSIEPSEEVPAGGKEGDRGERSLSFSTEKRSFLVVLGSF